MSKNQHITPSAAAAPAPAKGKRADGDATRLRLLEIAGLEFADHGYHGTTGKAICARAGVPVASVNYHFGSRDGLYEAVLVEAHSHMFSLESMQGAIAKLSTPSARLQAALGFYVEVASRPDMPWSYRVLLRELLSPSAFLPALAEKGFKPKVALMLTLVAEFVGLPTTHPAVQRCLLFSVLPCIAMLLAPRGLSNQVVPGALDGAEHPFAADFMSHTLAGLQAIAKKYTAK